MYSKKLVTKAGLDPSTPPKTWDDFRAYAKQIAATGVPGFIELTKENTGGWHLTNWIYTGGGDLETGSGGKTTPALTNHKTLAFPNHLHTITPTYQPIPPHVPLR